ncbi:MAG: ATP-binding protein, partial [Candidatus Kapabacteria bacterium]|nr:ATP-binding protein [Candidatus Kapabacteria bacterium]
NNVVQTMCLARASAPQGFLWIPTQGGGLHLLNPEIGTMQRYRHIPGDPTSINTDSLRAVFEDSKGRLWVATSGYGLLLFSREKGVIATYQTSLSNNTVTSIFEDSAGRLWIATASGLNRLIERGTPQEYRFQRFSAKDGLPSEFVYGMCEDAEGNLWMSTNNGLVCFTPSTGAIRTFDVHDGLQSNEFNTGAFYKGSDGRLYFGGIRGYNFFQPAQVLSYKPPPLPVILISFKVHDRVRAFAQPLADLTDITLEYDENEISFEFVALDYTGASKQIRYKYMLENFDTEWIQSGTRRYAAYTNLEPGEYRFRVQAMSGTNPLHNAGDGTSIRIRIRPPFWRTWWFRLSSVAIGLLLLWGGVQWRLRGIQRQNEILEEQVRLRTEELMQANEYIQRQNVQLHDQNIALELAIAELAELNREKSEFLGIVAHDLKNPLTGIMLSVQLIERYRKRMSDTELGDMLRKIYVSAERMFGIVKNLLDINAIESGKFTFAIEAVSLCDIAHSAIEDYRSRAAAKDIRLIYETYPESQHTAFLALCDKAAVAQIVDNLVSNAVKYSPRGKQVWVRVYDCSPEDLEKKLVEQGIPLTRALPSGTIIVAVQDEGPGISDADKAKLFGRFVKLSARPTGDEDSTGLGLSIVKKMVEAMNGTVWCESEYGKGATFLVALPRA